MAKIVELVSELASSLAEHLGLELVDVEYVKEGGQMVLRVFIDREGGVAHHHCEAMSRVLDDELEKLDPIEHAYLLEVSSAGIERPLKKEKDYVRFSGRTVKVKLFSPLNGQKNYAGTLRGLDGEYILLENEKKEVMRILLSQVAKAHLSYI